MTTPQQKKAKTDEDEKSKSVITFEKNPLKQRSVELTGDPSLGPNDDHWMKRTGSRPHLWAAGYKGKDFGKPIITVAAPYLSVHMCNQLFRVLADHIAEELDRKDMKAFVSHQPVISDGQTMGTLGMRYSLPSRDLIADCIETMNEGYFADGIITISGCDKTSPGVLMPIARHNRLGSQSMAVLDRVVCCTVSDSLQELHLKQLENSPRKLLTLRS
eukprot:m.20803 g.20803  ORF g.20803 m.20803 type:complete len:216 (+) comp8626_c0_seq1:21-668(+)